MPTAHLYTRVSTDKQDTASQMNQLQDLIATLPHARLVWYQDELSGSTPWAERKLGQILTAAAPGDYVLVSEVSRIARSTLGVLSFLQAAQERQLTVIAARNKLTLDGSLPSKITITVLALASEIERDLLRERTRAALAQRRAQGQALGRPPGSKSESKLAPQLAEIERCLAARVSKRSIARLLRVSPNTLYRYLRDKGLHTTPQEDPL